MNLHRIAYEKRVSDDWGSGDFAASRGDRLHLGRDYLCAPGEAIRAPMEGRVVRIGYPYSDAPEYRLIELLTGRVLWRFFYVKPVVLQGEFVTMAKVIGHSQDISKKYQKADRGPMGNHVHVECIVDPEAFFDLLESANSIGGSTWV